MMPTTVCRGRNGFGVGGSGGGGAIGGALSERRHKFVASALAHLGGKHRACSAAKEIEIKEFAKLSDLLIICHTQARARTTSDDDVASTAMADAVAVVVLFLYQISTQKR